MTDEKTKADIKAASIEGRLAGAVWIYLGYGSFGAYALKAFDGELLIDVKSDGNDVWRVRNKRYHGELAAKAAAIAMLRAEAAA